tara:strand:- start:2988 stop:3179 length:192 start_codon:yes stop_codon:yes gene_type:complete
MNDVILIDDVKDSTIMKPKQFKIETPIGSVESDSGSHMMDIVSVISVIAIFYVFVKLLRKWIK